ncbi:MAG: YCF48-related protein, partial [Blastocatellia bacterium]
AIWLYSSDFDTYLYLIAPSGAVIAENDDGGGRTNARLPSGVAFFTLPTSGTYTIEVTSFSGARTGNYTISLSAGSPNCAYSISSNNQSFTAAGGAHRVNVTAGSGCDWQAASGASWATISSGASGAGAGVVNFTVAPNQGGARAAKLFVAGQIFTVIQPGANLFAGGKWGSQTSGTSNNLNSVHFISNDRGWAAGAAATLQSTNDAGATWNPVNTGAATTENFHSVRFVDSSYGWVGGERVTAATFNGGSAWGRLNFSSGSRRRLFPINTISAWAVGETQGQGAHFFDLLVLSPFGGFGSGTPALTFAETLNDVYVLDGANLWSVGANGRIIRAFKGDSPNAAVFTAQPSGVTGQLNSVFMLNLDFGWVAGNNGVILRTTDGGLTWTALSSGVTANLRDLHFTDADHGWGAADGGLILSTSNGGQTWSLETTGVTANLNSLFFTTNGTGYAAGDSGTILKRAACAYAVAPTSAQVEFGGGAGQVNVTTEAGCNWTAVSNDAWLTITSGASGSGNGVVAYSAAANPNGFPRTGTIFIAGHTFTVTQAAAPIPCPTVSGIAPASGVPGSTVTITGTNLSGATAKFAGNIAATTNSSSDTQLVVTVPNGAITGPITISKTFCLDVNTAPFTVIPVYEGDVAPRPLGSSSVTVADWTLIGHFVAGLETAEPGGEFQRADCSPRATLGDGRLTISDWVLAGRYATGLEPLTPAGGPTAPVTPTSVANVALRTDARISPANLDQNQNRRVRVAQIDRSGRRLTSAITLDARGDENALSFSLLFNPSQWRLVSAVAGRDARGAALSVNAAESSPGRIGLAMALPAGRSYVAGARELVILQFDAVSDASESPFAIGFGDRPAPREIVALDARVLKANFVNNSGVANVSSASFCGELLARDQIASLFGAEMTTQTVTASSLPLPTELGGVRISITDSAGVARDASLFFVSPEQINYLIPAEAALGIATITLTTATGLSFTDLIEIMQIAPSLFSANSDGQGAAAAVVLRIGADGSQRFEPMVAFDLGRRRFVPTPIDVSRDDEQVFLICYGTGWRGRSSKAPIKAMIGDTQVDALYVGPQGEMAGLDQLNVRLPKSLAGRGEVDLTLTVSDWQSNPVKIRIK